MTTIDALPLEGEPDLKSGPIELGDRGIVDWINGPLGNLLRRKKHVLPIMVALYSLRVGSTSTLVRQVHGHPHSIVDSIRKLERLGVLVRVRSTGGHHEMEARLTLRGLHLVETPIYKWRALFRKWNRMSR